jgi:hypothetical protein
MISVETKVTVRADLPSREVLKVTEGAGIIEITQYHLNGEATSTDIEIGDFRAFIDALEIMAGNASCAV